MRSFIMFLIIGASMGGCGAGYVPPRDSSDRTIPDDVQNETDSGVIKDASPLLPDVYIPACQPQNWMVCGCDCAHICVMVTPTESDCRYRCETNAHCPAGFQCVDVGAPLKVCARNG